MGNSEVQVDRLRFEDKDFRKWDQLHCDLEDKLTGFNRLKFLTAEEEVEKKRLQKQKLIAKDQMQRILYRYNKSL